MVATMAFIDDLASAVSGLVYQTEIASALLVRQFTSTEVGVENLLTRKEVQTIFFGTTKPLTAKSTQMATPFSSGFRKLIQNADSKIAEAGPVDFVNPLPIETIQKWRALRDLIYDNCLSVAVHRFWTTTSDSKVVLVMQKQTISGTTLAPAEWYGIIFDSKVTPTVATPTPTPTPAPAP